MTDFIAEIKSITSTKNKVDERVAKVTFEFIVDNEEVLNQLIKNQAAIVKCSVVALDT